MVCDLTDWLHEPSDKIAIDPVLGRIVFPSDLGAPPLVTFHYGFSANMGGGEYDRSASFDIQLRPDQLNAPEIQSKKVAKTGAEFSTIKAALDDLADGAAIIEITDTADMRKTRSASTQPIGASNSGPQTSEGPRLCSPAICRSREAIKIL